MKISKLWEIRKGYCTLEHQRVDPPFRIHPGAHSMHGFANLRNWGLGFRALGFRLKPGRLTPSLLHHLVLGHARSHGRYGAYLFGK